MVNRKPIRDEAIDLYEVLEVSPFARRSELAAAARRKIDQISNPTNSLSLSDRARTHELVTFAYDTLVSKFESKVKYDIGRMMRRGEISLEQISLPVVPDYPSAVVAKFRFQMVRVVLDKTLDALVAAYDDAMDERFMQQRVRGSVVDKDLEKMLDQMVVFTAHVTLDLRKVYRGTRAIGEMGDGSWASGIRDPTTTGLDGKPTLARSTLKELQALEERLSTRFWVQIARSLVKVDPTADRAGYAARLLPILGHVRY